MVKSLIEDFQAVHAQGIRQWGHEKGGLIEEFDPAAKANNMSGLEVDAKLENDVTQELAQTTKINIDFGPGKN